MSIRIYALAKELKIDNKDLMEACTKLGVSIKGSSALASLAEEDVDKIRHYLQGSVKKSAGGAKDASFFAPEPPKQAFGKIPTLPSSRPKKSSESASVTEESFPSHEAEETAEAGPSVTASVPAEEALSEKKPAEAVKAPEEPVAAPRKPESPAAAAPSVTEKTAEGVAEAAPGAVSPGAGISAGAAGLPQAAGNNKKKNVKIVSKMIYLNLQFIYLFILFAYIINYTIIDADRRFSQKRPGCGATN